MAKVWKQKKRGVFISSQNGRIITKKKPKISAVAVVIILLALINVLQVVIIAKVYFKFRDVTAKYGRLVERVGDKVEAAGEVAGEVAGEISDEVLKKVKLLGTEDWSEVKETGHEAIKSYFAKPTTRGMLEAHIAQLKVEIEAYEDKLRNLPDE